MEIQWQDSLNFEQCKELGHDEYAGKVEPLDVAEKGEEEDNTGVLAKFLEMGPEDAALDVTASVDADVVAAVEETYLYMYFTCCYYKRGPK